MRPVVQVNWTCPPRGRNRRHLDTCTALTSVCQSAAHHCFVHYLMSSGRDASGHCRQPVIRPQVSSAAGCRLMQLCQLPLSHVWSTGPAWQPLLNKYITAHIHYWSQSDQASFCSGYRLPSRQSLHGFTTKNVTITHRTVLSVLNICEMRGKENQLTSSLTRSSGKTCPWLLYKLLSSLEV